MWITAAPNSSTGIGAKRHTVLNTTWAASMAASDTTPSACVSRCPRVELKITRPLVRRARLTSAGTLSVGRPRGLLTIVEVASIGCVRRGEISLKSYLSVPAPAPIGKRRNVKTILNVGRFAEKIDGSHGRG